MHFVAITKPGLSAKAGAFALLAMPALLFTFAALPAHAADEAGPLCQSVQAFVAAENQIDSGKPTAFPAVIMHDIVADCSKQTVIFHQSVPLSLKAISTRSIRMAQILIDNNFCKHPTWRPLIDQGWTLGIESSFRGKGTRTTIARCAGIKAPMGVATAGRAAPASDSQLPRGEVREDVPPPAPPEAVADRKILRTDGMPTLTKAVAFDISGQPIVVYEAVSLNPDCSIVGAAVIKVVQQPQHGTVQVVAAPVFTRYPPSDLRSACNARAVQGYRVSYQSKHGYLGADAAELNVFWPDGTAVDVTVPLDVR